MKIKAALADFVNRTADRRLINRKSLMTSYVSLFLIFAILGASTLSWFTIQDTASITSDTFTLESSSGLRVNEGESLTNHIVLEDFTLDEASSVDGRNLFFPTTGSDAGSSTTKIETQNLLFREGNVGDKNTKYVYKDFTLRGDSAVTYVYVKSFEVKVGDEVFDGSTDIKFDNDGKPVSQTKHDECPIRIAFINNSDKTPIVIDPTAIVTQHTNSYNAVSSTASDGSANVSLSTAQAFSDYYFVAGSPIFTLLNNEPLDVTMVVWLEGSENKDNNKSNIDEYAGKSISIDIELESNFSDSQTVTFVDKTLNDDKGNPANYTTPDYWINSKDSDGNDTQLIIMTYKNQYNKVKTVVMSHVSTYEWQASLPDYATTDIIFYRYSIEDETIYNSWRTEVGVNDELNPTITQAARNPSATDAGKYCSDWIGYYGNLQENRIKDDGSLSLVYTAYRGNKYGKVSESDSELEKKRLSPCLGYWQGKSTTQGYGDTQTTTATKATTATATTSSSSSSNKVNLSIYVGQLKSWVQLLLNDKGYSLYAYYKDGSKTKLNKDSSDYYKVENVSVPSGTYIQYFAVESSSDKQVLTISSGSVSITSNINVSFEMQNDDTLKKL
jgi:hypothetical protein